MATESVTPMSHRTDDPLVESLVSQCDLDVVRKLTDSRFGNCVEEFVDSDPDDATNRFVVFRVETSGDAEDVIQRQLAWHRDVANLTNGGADRFTLMIEIPDRIHCLVTS